MNVMPAITRALGVTIFRDGGSFATKFEDGSGHCYILFTKIEIDFSNRLTMERIGYKQPVLIDCNPAERPQDTVHITPGDMCGPRVPVTWDQARALMALAKPLAVKLIGWRLTRALMALNKPPPVAKAIGWYLKYLECMTYVVANDGAVPPSMRSSK